MLGSGIMKAMEDIVAKGIEISSSDTKKGKLYTFGGDTYHVEITIEEK